MNQELVNPPHTNGSAIAALVLGIAALVTCGITAPFAIWMFFRANRRIVASGGAEKGGGLAVTGLALSIVGLVIGVLVAIWLIFFVAIFTFFAD